MQRDKAWAPTGRKQAGKVGEREGAETRLPSAMASLLTAAATEPRPPPRRAADACKPSQGGGEYHQ